MIRKRAPGGGRRPDVGTARDAQVKLRVTPGELRAYALAAGALGVSAYVRRVLAAHIVAHGPVRAQRALTQQ